MTIQLLISTMHQNGFDLLKKMNVSTDAVVINQCDKNEKYLFQFNGCSIVWINTTERGLSKSRNMAIRNASADICLLADDDMEYRQNYADVVTRAFEQNPKFAIITFQVEGIERKYKTYSKSSHTINLLNSMKISSVEMAFRRDSIAKLSLKFDELIGAGTEFMMGEENVFVYQALKKGLKACFVPEIIANLHLGDSSWFKGYTKEYFVGKGAAFTAMQSGMTFLLIFQFAIRKRYLYKKDISVFSSIALMMKGKKTYNNRRKGRDL